MGEVRKEYEVKLKSLREMIVPEWGRNLKGGETALTMHQLHQDILDNIDTLEASAVRVYGNSKGDYAWSPLRGEHCTHSALLICVEPLDRRVSKEEAGVISNYLFKMDMEKEYEIFKRILEYGIEK